MVRQSRPADLIALLLASLTLLLAACSTGDPPPLPASGNRPVEYHLGPGDRLSIKVFGQADLSGEFEIAGDGALSLPLIGQVPAGNLTLTELRESLTRTLDEKFVVDPKVSIEVTNYRPFFILGQVNNPGSYPYRAGISMRMAVALAGGFTRRAREEQLWVYRKDDAGGWQRTVIGPDEAVLPGDTIEVQRRLF